MLPSVRVGCNREGYGQTMQLGTVTGFPLLISMVLASPGTVLAEDLGRALLQCGTTSSPQHGSTPGVTGGKHIPSAGMFRILVVFASFPDDQTPHPFWPAHGPPLFMRQFIDSDTTTKLHGSFNLTNYFRQMSLNQFQLVGDVLWVETTHSKDEYSNGSYGRANTDALRECVDPLVDFSQYDRWTRQGDYEHAPVPDGQVDMIVMVWRTTLFEYLGEASLGYKPVILADGRRIEMGFPESVAFPRGSGVTCEYPYSDTPYQVMQTMAHEIGHWLLGGLHPYNSTSLHGKHAYWGILCNGLRTASCMNSYEREGLGWISVPEMQTDVDIPLPDYLTTGAAYKYHPAGGEPFEYFYIENHQQLSVFDDVTLNPDDKGVWILHQQGPYLELDNLCIRPSDGNWNWENPGVTAQCFSQELPVFKKGVPRALTGESHRDQIPTATSLVNWMHVYQDPAGAVNCGAFFKGQMFEGAFHPNSSVVFSRYSNPGSSTWDNRPTAFSLEIVGVRDGIVTVRNNADPLQGPPARRYLGPDPLAGGRQGVSLSLAWGTQWTNGQPMEADVNWSELQRLMGNETSWSTVYEGPAAQWSCPGAPSDTSSTVRALFRVRVRDTQGRYSVWSNVFHTVVAVPTAVRDERSEADRLPLRFWLGANYPNPFNLATVLIYQVPVAGTVKLAVYDLLGREVATLVDERKEAGTYQATFDAAGHASGMYIYRLQAGNYVGTRKLLLQK